MGDEQPREFYWREATMIYTRSGAGSDAVVLVHGIGMGHRVFRDLAEALEANATVYAIDLPGFGDSPEPETAHDMGATGELLAAFIAELGPENPLLVGFVQYAKAGPRWFLRKLRAMLAHRVEERHPLVRARTLVIRGEEDRVVPRDWARFVVDTIPDARLVEVPERGHEAMIRSALPVARMIEDFAVETRTRRG